MHRGTEALPKEGLKAPLSVNIATRQYAQQSDKIGNFIDECLEECQGGGCTAKEAYDVYKKWCTDCGYYAEGKQKFMELMRGKSLLRPTATIDGKIVRNVIVNYIVSRSE